MDDTHFDFLKDNGVLLYTGEYALTKQKALEYIHFLDNKFFILGGDLYVKKGDKLYPDASSWYMEPENYTISDSVEYTIKFIKQFEIANDLFFVISVQCLL
jgi:hypothetical protein